MKKVAALVLVILLYGCSHVSPEIDSTEEYLLSLANPASTFCIQQGGTLEFRDEANGQVGYCTLPDGNTIEEWDYFREQNEQEEVMVPEIPTGCTSWFDGCNNCQVAENGMLACTRKYCAPEVMEQAKCIKFKGDEIMPIACGGISGFGCSEGMECRLDGDYPDAGGICVSPSSNQDDSPTTIPEVPVICTMEYKPVCGIDGVTYGNKCTAGDIEISYEGECE